MYITNKKPCQPAWLVAAYLQSQSPLDTKQLFGNLLQANLLAWYGKTKPNTTKAHIHQSRQMYCNTKINKSQVQTDAATFHIQQRLSGV